MQGKSNRLAPKKKAKHFVRMFPTAGPLILLRGKGKFTLE